mgnify:CR=1 FL=1
MQSTTHRGWCASPPLYPQCSRTPLTVERSDARTAQRAAWATASDKMDGGECYMVSDMAPDATKEWYFCSAPMDGAGASCEPAPEWMGTLSDGSKVYICTTPKV